jgi:hypothetical protein
MVGKKIIVNIYIIILVLMIGCLPVDDKISKEDAQSQIYFA